MQNETRLLTTVELPEDDHLGLRVAAIQRRVTIQQAVQQAVKMWLAGSGMPVTPATKSDRNQSEAA